VQLGTESLKDQDHDMRHCAAALVAENIRLAGRFRHGVGSFNLPIVFPIAISGKIWLAIIAVTY
jgi:hypothetical protein